MARKERNTFACRRSAPARRAPFTKANSSFSFSTSPVQFGGFVEISASVRSKKGR